VSSPLIVLLLGAPGTGKSTYGQYLARKFDVPWISTGRLLREVAQRDERIASLIESGELVPDEHVERALFDRLAAAASGFVLDGYPRTVAQARNFLRYLDERSQKITRVFHLCAPDEVLVQRLLARGRGDDRPDVIRERMRLYRLETEAIIGVLRSGRTDIVEVDASPPMDEVERVLEASLRLGP
jgi:adenylate kinase